MEFSETKKKIKYDDLLDIDRIKLMYFLIRKHTRNKLFKENKTNKRQMVYINRD